MENVWMSVVVHTGEVYNVYDELWSGNMAYSVTRDIDIRQVVERSPFVWTSHLHQFSCKDLVPATCPMNSNWFELKGQAHTTCPSKSLMWTVHGTWDLSPCVCQPSTSSLKYFHRLWVSKRQILQKFLAAILHFFFSICFAKQCALSHICLQFQNIMMDSTIKCV